MGELIRPGQPIDLSELDRAEYEGFLKEHSLIPIEERRQQIRAELSDEERELLELADSQVLDLEEGLITSSQVERLRGLHQLAGKKDPEVTVEMGGGIGMLLPPFHTRHEHSELLAELVKVAAVKAGILKSSDGGEISGMHDYKLMITAAWLHDIGHPAFSHMGEEFLASRSPHDHEARSLELLNKNNIQKLLEDNDLETTEVQMCMNERGALGTIQNFCDTLSYLILDSEKIKRPAYSDQGARVVSDIRGVDNNTLVVANLPIWQELLDNRAKMSQDIYYHPDNKRTQGALVQLLRLAVDKGHITLKEVEDGTDDELRARLQSLVQVDRGAAIRGGRRELKPHMAKYKLLYGLSIGFYDNSEWNHFMCDDEEQAYKIASRFPPTCIEMSVIVKPYDYRKKTLRLKIQDGQEHTLSTPNVKLREYDKKFHLYIPVAEKMPDFNHKKDA